MGHVFALIVPALLAAAPGGPTTAHADIIRHVRQQGGVATYVDDCNRPALHLVLSGLLATDADVNRLAGVRGIGGLDL